MNRNTAVTQEVTQDELLSEASIIAASSVPPRRHSGIYFLIKAGAVMYVGKSVDVHARLAGHRWRDFDRWHWIPCAPEDLDVLERRYIDAFMSPWNGDSRTAAIRTEVARANAPSPPPLDLPLAGVSPEILAAWLDEGNEYDKTHWTLSAVRDERMRRLRALRGNGGGLEDFGPMPQVGDLL